MRDAAENCFLPHLMQFVQRGVQSPVNVVQAAAGAADEAHLLVAQFLADVEHVAVAAPTSVRKAEYLLANARKGVEALARWRQPGRSVDHLTTVSQPACRTYGSCDRYMYLVAVSFDGAGAGELDLGRLSAGRGVWRRVGSLIGCPVRCLRLPE